MQLEFAVKVVMSDDEILERAREILASRLRRAASVLDAPDRVREYLTMHYAELQHEVLGCCGSTRAMH